MNPANEISPAYETFLKQKYNITEEFSKEHPEDFANAILIAKSLEDSVQEAFQSMNSSEQTEEETSNIMKRLIEGSERLHAQQDRIAKLQEESGRDLQNLVKTSSEIKEITERAANVVKRVFNPVRHGINGFYFLIGHRAPAAALPRENRLAIEYPTENTSSTADSTNPSPIDEKKKSPNLLKLLLVVSGLSFLYIEGRKIFWCFSAGSRLD